MAGVGRPELHAGDLLVGVEALLETPGGLAQHQVGTEYVDVAVGEPLLEQQRDLAAAKAAELSAVVTWQSARINLDSITGTIIESSGITLAEGKTGRVAQ